MLGRYDAILTVGSTEFTALVHAFLDSKSLSALANIRGIKTVLAQVGNSTLPTGWKQGPRQFEETDLVITVIRFSSDLETQIGQAQLVVSHAGKQAGDSQIL